MTPLPKLSMLLEHVATARKALYRTQAAALAGELAGETLIDDQCDHGCPECKLGCAGLLHIVASLERQIADLGGLTINGVSYAFAGRA